MSSRIVESIQTLREEIANGISHGIGLALAIVAAPVLIVSAVRRGDAANIAGAAIFAGTLILLYLASTLYHSIQRPGAKRVFRILDHSAIYLLIAGTYTPFTLGVLRGGWGWTLLAIIWGLAVAGVLIEAVGRIRHRTVSVALYLGMGWMVVVAVRPLWVSMPPWGLFWLAAGGLAYTLGVPFYAAKRIPHNHLIWHLFVLGGTACHTVAVLRYSG